MVDADDTMFDDAIRILLSGWCWCRTYYAMFDARGGWVRVEMVDWKLAWLVGTVVGEGIGSDCLT